MTTFFDVSPFSPGGRYLVATQVPFIWRTPYPGDCARVGVIDLVDNTWTPIYDTIGWGAQLGANAQWGADDHTVYCNDVVDGKGVGVAIDRTSLRVRHLQGPIFGLTPDRRYSFSADLSLINAGIPGYGVPEAFIGRRRLRTHASPTEGVWRTDIHTGRCELFLSLADLVRAVPAGEQVRGGTNYVFNVKVNRQGTRLLIIIFTRRADRRLGWPTQLLTCDIDGGNVQLAMPDRLWRRGGHHPNWTPDGDHILMNLKVSGNNTLSFVRFRYDGSGLEVVAPGHKGSGHPSLNPSATHLLTDAYVRDGFTDGQYKVPIRLIDLESTHAAEIARVYTNRIPGPRRVDPHPVWSESGLEICFNGVIAGRRQILIADVASYLSTGAQ